jgi:Flp pilus assembly protein TadG
MVHHSNDEMSQLTNTGTAPLRGCRCEPTNQHPKRNRFGSLVHWSIGSLERGSVSIEMVFFLLIFVVAFFGAVEVAREVSVKHALDVGTYRATRYLSIVPNDQVTARNMIQNELNANVLGGSGNVVMTINMPSQSFQTVFSVTADVSYQPVIPLMIFAPKTLQVIHSQSIEAYP